MIITLDLRLIFDEDEQSLIVGCHRCEQTQSAPLNDIPACAALQAEFSMEHIRSCGTKRA